MLLVVLSIDTEQYFYPTYIAADQNAEAIKSAFIEAYSKLSSRENPQEYIEQEVQEHLENAKCIKEFKINVDVSGHHTWKTIKFQSIEQVENFNDAAAQWLFSRFRSGQYRI